MLWSKFIPSTPSSPGVLLEPPLPCNFKNEILGSGPSIYTEVLALLDLVTVFAETKSQIKIALYLLST
jgi:hypothetical protein